MRQSGSRLVLLAGLFGLASCLGPAAAASASTSTTKTISVVVKSPWTPTGITIHKGDRVTVIASGKAHFGSPPIDAVPPTGISRTSSCERLGGGARWAAASLSCYALIARVGSGPIFEIGRARNFVADHSGQLELGANDNVFGDNSGSWSAQVVTTPVSTSNSFPLASVALGIAAVGAVVALVALLLRSAQRRKANTADDVVDTALLVPPDAARRSGGIAPENDEVNIFAVELEPDGLRVGYSYFPAGTIVRWSVLGDAGGSVRGEFAAEGGGSTPHMLTLPFDEAIVVASADVRFEWSIGGVPFRYGVKRELAHH